jgi:fumarate hydratase class II
MVPPLFQKIGYDNAAAVAKLAHKEGSTLKVIISTHLSYSTIYFVYMPCDVHIL